MDNDNGFKDILKVYPTDEIKPLIDELIEMVDTFQPSFKVALNGIKKQRTISGELYHKLETLYDGLASYLASNDRGPLYRAPLAQAIRNLMREISSEVRELSAKQKENNDEENVRTYPEPRIYSDRSSRDSVHFTGPSDQMKKARAKAPEHKFSKGFLALLLSGAIIPAGIGTYQAFANNNSNSSDSKTPVVETQSLSQKLAELGVSEEDFSLLEDLEDKINNNSDSLSQEELNDLGSAALQLSLDITKDKIANFLNIESDTISVYKVPIAGMAGTDSAKYIYQVAIPQNVLDASGYLASHIDTIATTQEIENFTVDNISDILRSTKLCAINEIKMAEDGTISENIEKNILDWDLENSEEISDDGEER